MFLSVTVPLALVILTLSGSHGQTPTTPIPCVYDPIGNLVAGFCCDDCKQEHGAINGTCNPNNICVCHYEGDKMLPPPNFIASAPILNPLAMLQPDPVQQCKNTPTLLYPTWRTYCDLDCQCVHGALGGTCDFVKQKCTCHFPPNTTFSNVDTFNCLYCSPGEIVTVATNLLNQITAAANTINNIPLLAQIGLLPPIILPVIPPTKTNGTCPSHTV